MEPSESSGAPLIEPRVLASGLSQGQRVELLEHSDGSLAIICNGDKQAFYSAGAANLDSCIKVYMNILRGGADA